jgi:hypothetical protein
MWPLVGGMVSLVPTKCCHPREGEAYKFMMKKVVEDRTGLCSSGPRKWPSVGYRLLFGIVVGKLKGCGS